MCLQAVRQALCAKVFQQDATVVARRVPWILPLKTQGCPASRLCGALLEGTCDMPVLLVLLTQVTGQKAKVGVSE